VTSLIPFALALQAAAAGADTAALHAAIQGRWRADVRALAEQVPGWKSMSPRQRETVLAILPPMIFEITADRIVLEAAGPGEEDEPVRYTVSGSEGRKLRLDATDAAGEKKRVSVEVLGPDLVQLTSAEGPPLRLNRVRPDPPTP
jgi:hypothetical protein